MWYYQICSILGGVFISQSLKGLELPSSGQEENSNADRLALSNLNASAISLNAIALLDKALSHLHYGVNDDNGPNCAPPSSHSMLPLFLPP